MKDNLTAKTMGIYITETSLGPIRRLHRKAFPSLYRKISALIYQKISFFAEGA